MRSGNYMTQDRMIALSDSAGEILDWYGNLQKRIKIFLHEGEREVSLDTMNELLLQDAPDFEAIETILAERAHFRNRGNANRRARDQMQLLRENRQENAIEFSRAPYNESIIAIGNNGQTEKNQEYQEDKPIDLSQLDLNNPGTYEEFHRTLRANLDTTGFVWESDICRTLLIAIKDIGPIIKKMIDLDMLQAQSANGKNEMMNRYHIL